MLKGDRRCEKCGRVIFSYTKVQINFKNYTMQCPHCRNWLKLETPKPIKQICVENKRERSKTCAYSKAEAKHQSRLKKLRSTIEGNYRITNTTLIEKLGVSKATFYNKYKDEAERLRKHYKSIALF